MNALDYVNDDIHTLSIDEITTMMYNLHVADAVELINNLELEKAVKIIDELDLDHAIELFDMPELSRIEEILSLLPTMRAVALMEGMSADEAADAFQAMNEATRKRLTQELPAATVERHQGSRRKPKSAVSDLSGIQRHHPRHPRLSASRHRRSAD